MIFKIKYNFVILELIGQPYFDLKRNNSKNLWNKCLIICFRIDSLSSNIRDNTTHLSMQHCFHVVFYIIGTKYLHIMHPEKDKSFRTCINGYISNHNKMRCPRPKFKVSFLFIFLLFLNQCYSNKLWKHQKKNTKNHFWLLFPVKIVI